MSVAGPAAKAGLVFAALMVTLPFVNPVHTYPIPGFYEAALAIGLGLLAVACLAQRNRSSNLGIPHIALWSAALSGFLFLQSTWPSAPYAEPAQLAGLYLLWAAAMMCAGFHLRAIFGAEKVADTLAASILVAALANAGLGWIQMLDMTDFYGGWGAYPTKVSGFIAQRNLYANYLVVGVACLLYLWKARRLSSFSTLIAALLLASGIELSGSRASVLMLGWLFVFALWYVIKGRNLSIRRGLLIGAIALMLIGTIAVGTYLLMPHASVSARVYTTVIQGTDIVSRVGMYKAAITSWLSAPFFGVGIDGYAWAHYQLATEWFEGDRITANAHDILLHSLVEMGLIGTTILVAGVGFWLVGSLRDLAAHRLLPQALAIAIVGIELAHSTVEFPLWSAEYLGFAALMMGVSDPKCILPSSVKTYAAMTAAVVILGGALLVSTIGDYRELRRLDYAVSAKSPDDKSIRADLQGVAGRLEHSILHPYFDLRQAFSMQLASEDLEQKIILNEKVMRLWPDYRLIQNQIVFLALAGRDQEGLALLARLAKLQPWALNDLRNKLDGISFAELPEGSPLRFRVDAQLPRVKK